MREHDTQRWSCAPILAGLLTGIADNVRMHEYQTLLKDIVLESDYLGASW